MSYVYRRRFAWVRYPEAGADDAPANHQPEYVGFAAEILVNPQGGEVNDEAQRWDDVTKGRAVLGDYLAAMAERVKAWEYSAETMDGAIAPVPPPAVAGGEAFLTLPHDLMYWLIVRIKRAHLPKAVTPSSTSAGPTDGDTPNGSDPEQTPLAD